MDAFDNAVKSKSNDQAHVLDEENKVQPHDRASHSSDFRDKCHKVISNPEVKDADETFTPEVFNDIYLNMELALPQGGSLKPRLAKVTKWLRDAMGCQLGLHMRSQYLTLRFMRLSIWMVRRHHSLPTTLLRNCLHRLMMMVIGKSLWMKLSIIMQMGLK